MPPDALTDLPLALARRPVAGLDPVRYLGAVADEIARALGVAGAVLVVPATGWVRGSDELATLVGEMQHRDGRGPLTTVLRTTRPMLTPDLTRIGPPALAALAADAGFGSAAAVALHADGRVVAALQVIGGPAPPVEMRHVEALGPVVDVLGARIADLVEIARLRRIPGPPPSSTPAPPQPAQLDRLDVTFPRPAPGSAEPEPAPVPLNASTPELATQEIRAVATNVVPLPRLEPSPRSRHRRDG